MKTKCVSLTFTKGPAGSRPRFGNHFPVAASSDVGLEQKRSQGNVSSFSEDIFEASGGSDGCTALT